MKKAVISIILLAFVASASGVANYNGSGDSDMHIMGAPDSSDLQKGNNSSSESARATQTGSTSEGENWEMNLTKLNASCSSDSSGSNMSDVSFSQDNGMNKFSFEASIQGSNPCEELETEVSSTDTGYVLNVRTESGGGFCVQCVGQLDYRVNFRTNAENLELRHEGSQVRTFKHPAAEEENSGEKGNSGGPIQDILSGIFGWFT